MALSLAGSSFGTTNSGTTIAPTAALPAVAGHTQKVTIFFTRGSNATITVPAVGTWTLVDRVNNSTTPTNDGVAVYKNTGTLQASPTFTFDALTEMVAFFEEWAGSDASLVDGTQHKANDINTNASPYVSDPGSITPTNLNNAITHVAFRNDVNTVTTAPSGYTEANAGGAATTTTPLSMRAYYKLTAGTSSQDPTTTWSNASAFEDLGASTVSILAGATGPTVNATDTVSNVAGGGGVHDAVSLAIVKYPQTVADTILSWADSAVVVKLKGPAPTDNVVNTFLDTPVIAQSPPKPRATDSVLNTFVDTPVIIKNPGWLKNRWGFGPQPGWTQSADPFLPNG